MKLIDILAQKLTVWPEGADFAVCVSDAKETFTVSYTTGGKPKRDPYDRRIHPWTVLGVPGVKWFLRHNRQVIDKPCDRFSAIVGREEWQAARDALIAENPSLHLQEVGRITRVAQQWNGEGLPPVGTVCEFQGDCASCPSDPWHKDLHDGVECTVIAHFKSKDLTVVAFTFVRADGYVELEQSLPGALKPIRTAEQIAEDEREKLCKQICIDAGSPECTTSQMQTAYRLFDAGYRKVDK